MTWLGTIYTFPVSCGRRSFLDYSLLNRRTTFPAPSCHPHYLGLGCVLPYYSLDLPLEKGGFFFPLEVPLPATTTPSVTQTSYGGNLQTCLRLEGGDDSFPTHATLEGILPATMPSSILFFFYYSWRLATFIAHLAGSAFPPTNTFLPSSSLDLAVVGTYLPHLYIPLIYARKERFLS